MSFPLSGKKFFRFYVLQKLYKEYSIQGIKMERLSPRLKGDIVKQSEQYIDLLNPDGYQENYSPGTIFNVGHGSVQMNPTKLFHYYLFTVQRGFIGG